MRISIVIAISTWPFPALFLRFTFPARFTHMGKVSLFQIHLMDFLRLLIAASATARVVSAGDIFAARTHFTAEVLCTLH
jgi:hypothetical protein